MSAVLAAQYADLPALPTPESSNVASAAYADAFHRLFVEFKNGSVYAYDGVGMSVWISFQTAVSKGRWLDLVLKKGGYSYTRVR